MFNYILSTARIFATAAAYLSYALCTVLISEKVGLSFSLTALIICIGMALSMLPICFKGRERMTVEATEENFTFRTMLRYLRTNKYLLLYNCGYLSAGILGTSSAVELFVSYYLFGSALFSTLMIVIQSVPMFIVAFFMPRLLRRFDKMKLYRNCMAVQVIIGFIVYFVGYRSIAIYIALMLVRCVPLAIIGILGLTFTPDCAEYGFYKTGIDARGIAFSIQSFAAKFSTVAQSVGLFLLGLFGWVTIEVDSFAELAARGISQSPTALGGLWFVFALVPAIGGAISLIFYFLYKLNDKDVQVMAKCNAGEITRQQAESMLSRKY